MDINGDNDDRDTKTSWVNISYLCGLYHRVNGCRLSLDGEYYRRTSGFRKTEIIRPSDPTSLHNHLAQDCYILTDKTLGNEKPHKLYIARFNGKPVAAALESTAPDGYSGAIELLVGVLIWWQSTRCSRDNT